MKSLIIGAAALLSACTQPDLARVRSAGQVACDNRDELAALVEASGAEPAWFDSARASLDWLCAMLGMGG